MRGRPPKPTALKLIDGEVNKKRINQNEPQPQKTELPKPPVWMHPTAKSEWKRVGEELCKLGIVTEIDIAILVGYCTAWAKFVEAEKAIKKDGFLDGRIYKASHGNGSTAPYDWISNKAQEQMLKYAAELGIGASSRSRIRAIKGGNQPDDGAGLI